MPLPNSPGTRRHLHTRIIKIDGYERDDGLFEIEGHLTDVKHFDVNAAHFSRKAGDPVHDMKLRLTVDGEMNIVDAFAVTDGMPYIDECNKITPDYREKLKGQKIAAGFRVFLAGLFGKLKGCAHMTELLGSMAPAAIQAMYGQGRAKVIDPDKKPFQLDGCHALDTRGPVVAKFYPRWYQPESANALETKS
jgi:Protein of unknown function (DUF2889)